MPEQSLAQKTTFYQPRAIPLKPETARMRPDMLRSLFNRGGTPFLQGNTAMENDMIYWSQKALNKLDYAGRDKYPLKTDGILDDDTQSAVRRFQSNYLLPVTGRIDKDTYDKLMSYFDYKDYKGLYDRKTEDPLPSGKTVSMKRQESDSMSLFEKVRLLVPSLRNEPKRETLGKTAAPPAQEEESDLINDARILQQLRQKKETGQEPETGIDLFSLKKGPISEEYALRILEDKFRTPFRSPFPHKFDPFILHPAKPGWIIPPWMQDQVNGTPILDKGTDVEDVFKGMEKAKVVSKNSYLSMEEMQINAEYIHGCLIKEGWSENAIAALLGNMQEESTINPGRWQIGYEAGDMRAGFGLVQWTPSAEQKTSDFIKWCKDNKLDPEDIDIQLERIQYEVDNEIQWQSFRTDENMPFNGFFKSTEDIGFLARQFLLCYERPREKGAAAQKKRADNAAYWYAYFNK